MPADFLRKPTLLSLAFASGAAVMTFEMAGARALSPYFGSSTYIWANVIGVLMASLALGYMVGGRLADRRPRLNVLLLLFGVAGALGAFLPLVFNPLCRACVPEGIASAHSFRVNLLGSLLVTCLLLVPVVFLLAMTTPFLVRLMARSRETSGSAAGRVNGFGAVGSIVGTFLPTLILIPAVGPNLTFTVTGAALAAAASLGLALFGSGPVRWAGFAFLAPALLSGVLGARAVHGDPATLDERDSPYQYVRVYEKEGRRFLALNEGRDEFDSLLVEGKALTGGQYYDFLNLVVLHFDPALRRRLRVAMVGLAAGTYSRQLHHFFGDLYRVEIDGAEIDPEVLDVGRLYFGLEGPENRNLKASPSDGRLFLERANGDFDLIAIDAYSRQLYIPFHLITEEFFRLCHEKLAPGGFVAVNVCDFGSRSPALEAVRNTCARVFGNVTLLRIEETVNFLLYARKGAPAGGRDRIVRNLESAPLASARESADLKNLIVRALPNRTEHREEPGRLVLTDDHAPLEQLMDRSFRRVRKRLRIEETR
ncbi:MAG: spermidine synthase [Planctomycetota bacterium]|jgi:spermidine synthase